MTVDQVKFIPVSQVDGDSVAMHSCAVAAAQKSTGLGVFWADGQEHVSLVSLGSPLLIFFPPVLWGD